MDRSAAVARGPQVGDVIIIDVRGWPHRKGTITEITPDPNQGEIIDYTWSNGEIDACREGDLQLWGAEIYAGPTDEPQVWWALDA